MPLQNWQGFHGGLAVLNDYALSSRVALIRRG
jgi:hypothetical protein